MGEPGAGEISGSGLSPEISEAKARLFIQSLPKEGLALHLTNTGSIQDIKKLGLSPLGHRALEFPRLDRISEKLVNLISPKDIFVFYYFLRVSKKPSEGEYLPHETKKIINAIRKSFEESIDVYGESNIATARYGKIKPAIVLAKMPSKGLLLGGDHVRSYVSAIKGGLPIGASRLTIPNKDIIAILTSNQDISRRVFLVDDLLRNVVDGVINWKNNGAKQSGNPPRKIASGLLK